MYLQYPVNVFANGAGTRDREVKCGGIDLHMIFVLEKFNLQSLVPHYQDVLYNDGHMTKVWRA